MIWQKYNELVMLLENSGVPFKIIKHTAIDTVLDGLNVLDIPIEQTLKTLAFMADTRYIFVTLQGNKRLDYKKIAKTLTIDRRTISSIPIEILQDTLGYQQGGVSPFCLNTNIDNFFDAGVSVLGSVYIGMGVNTRTLKISASDVITLSKATIADLVKEDIYIE